MEEEWGFLRIDARNAFNEINRTVMLWVIRHEWPSGVRFYFNCYQRRNILQTSVRSLSDLVPTTDTSQNRRRAS